MANYYGGNPNTAGNAYAPNPAAAAAQNLNFYQSSYASPSAHQQPVSGHTTPFQAYSGGAASSAYGGGGPGAGFGGAGTMMGGGGPGAGGAAGFGGMAGVSGRMGESTGGLRTGWLAAFGTEGYEGEPPLLEELGVNFGHIKMKVGFAFPGGA